MVKDSSNFQSSEVSDILIERIESLTTAFAELSTDIRNLQRELQQSRIEPRSVSVLEPEAVTEDIEGQEIAAALPEAEEVPELDPNRDQYPNPDLNPN